MTTLANNFEGGSNSTTITTGNSGGASGNAFDVVSIGSGASLTYDNTHSAHGLLSANVTLPVSAVTVVAEWTASLTGSSVGQAWFRTYAYLTAYSTSNLRMIRAINGATFLGAVGVSSTGKIVTIDSTGTTRTTSTVSVPLNQWFRLEGYFIGSATVGQIQVEIFATSMDAIVPNEIDTTAATINTANTITGLTFGNPSSQASFTFWLDDLGASTTGYLGPSNTAIVYPQTSPVQARGISLPPGGRTYSNPGSAPPLLLKNSFEGGTSGVTVTAGNSGGASGNSFDIVGTGSGVTAFDNTRAAHGSLSVKLSTTTSSISYVQWAAFGKGTPVPKVWFRFYAYFTANPANQHRLWNATAGTGSVASVFLSTSGKLVVTYSPSGTSFTTFTNSVPLNQWFRVEGYVTASTVSGQISVSLYVMDSTIAIESHTSAATLNTSSEYPSTYSFGCSVAVASVGPFWMDDVGLSSTGYLGPVSLTGPASSGMPGTAVQPRIPQNAPAGRVYSNPGAPVPVLLTNSFEGGTNGVTISSSNSGGASGSEFSYLNIGSGATSSYSTAEYAHGSISGEFTVTSSATSYVGWSNYPTSSSQGFFVVQPALWYRFYAYFTSYPSAQLRLFESTSNNNAGRNVSILVNTNGTLSVTNGTGGTSFTTTNSIPLNQWFRTEGYIYGSPNRGQLSLSLFSPQDSQVPIETHSVSNINTTGPLNAVQFGVVSPFSDFGPFWLDDLGLSNTGPLGPSSRTAQPSSGFPGTAVQPRAPQNGPRGRVIQGQVLASTYVPPTSGPPVYPLQGPVQARIPQVFSKGRTRNSPGGLPSVLLLNSFEGGTAGTTVSTGNSGGVSGNAFDTVQIGSLATLTYDITESDAAGYTSAKFVTGASSANVTVTWNAKLGLQTQVWFRVYCYLPTIVGNNRLARILTPAGIFCGAVEINSSGKVVTLDEAAVSHTTSTTTVPLNKWFRLEGYFTGSPNAGQIQVQIFTSNPYGTVPDEIDTTPASINTIGPFGRFDFGNPSSVTNYTLWLDNLGVSNTGYLGPVLPRLYGALVTPARARIPWNAPRGRVYTSASSPVVPLVLRSLVFNLGIPYLQWETGSVKTQWTVP